MHLASLHIYPVKSLRGIPRHCAGVDELGLIGDRRFLVIDGDNRFLTQRTIPRFALITTALTENSLVLQTDTGEKCTVPVPSQPGAELRRVAVWKDNVAAEDCGEEASVFLTRFLGRVARLVRIGRDYLRPVISSGASSGANAVSFADAFPFLLISQGSLADLNDRLVARGGDTVPMDRFRPNLVIAGCAPHAEDGWNRFRIGNVVFQRASPCARCVVTTIDQSTAARGEEPLRTLATYRRNAGNPAQIDFGQNLVHETKAGTMQVGDRVELL